MYNAEKLTMEWKENGTKIGIWIMINDINALGTTALREEVTEAKSAAATNLMSLTRCMRWELSLQLMLNTYEKHESGEHHG